MKHFILSLAVVLSCTACASQQNAFKSFADHFGKTAAFAYANVGGRDVLLVSHEVFGDDEAEGLQAIAASIFALDSDGKIVTLGSIRSQGTLYPISVADNKLLVAGHTFVNIFDIRGEEPELVMADYEDSDYDSPQLKALFKTFEDATPVIFKKKRSK